MPQKKCNGRIEYMLIEYRSTSNNNNNFMQQQALIMEMARMFQNKTSALKRANYIICQAQIMFIIKIQEQFSMVYTLSPTEMTSQINFEVYCSSPSNKKE